MSDALRLKLSAELASIAWRDLRPHAARGALFLVSGDLDLVEATVAVARDDKQAVAAWLELGTLARPSQAQMTDWERDLDKPFQYLIAQPFVLASEVRAG